MLPRVYHKPSGTLFAWYEHNSLQGSMAHARESEPGNLISIAVYVLLVFRNMMYPLMQSCFVHDGLGRMAVTMRMLILLALKMLHCILKLSINLYNLHLRDTAHALLLHASASPFK